jgi:hypothetical protein
MIPMLGDFVLDAPWALTPRRPLPLRQERGSMGATRAIGGGTDRCCLRGGTEVEGRQRRLSPLPTLDLQTVWGPQ